MDIIENILAPHFSNSDKIVFIICGKGTEKRTNTSNIICLGFVPNIEDIIHSCDCVIVPLVSGSGTRLKIIESLGLNKKVIATRVAPEGLDKNVCGNNLILVDDHDWDRFHTEMLSVIDQNTHPILNEFLTKYEWGNITRQINL